MKIILAFNSLPSVQECDATMPNSFPAARSNKLLLFLLKCNRLTEGCFYSSVMANARIPVGAFAHYV